MSTGTRELAERRARLQLRCARQRQHLATEVRSIERRLNTIDRVALMARQALTEPLVIVTAFVGTLVVGPARVMRVVGRALLVSVALRRLWSLLRR